ncbi:hypothetical protein WJ71_09495 [Burkholderia ubonensis]|nr:hypothetical protein WJ71_09495 [Burkholderia ubonensis]
MLAEVFPECSFAAGKDPERRWIVLEQAWPKFLQVFLDARGQVTWERCIVGELCCATLVLEVACFKTKTPAVVSPIQIA